MASKGLVSRLNLAAAAIGAIINPGPFIYYIGLKMEIQVVS
jgi:hypothetical protein